MNIWLIGGGVYIALALFALAICRAAASPDPTIESEPLGAGADGASEAKSA